MEEVRGHWAPETLPETPGQLCPLGGGWGLKSRWQMQTHKVPRHSQRGMLMMAWTAGLSVVCTLETPSPEATATPLGQNPGRG